VRLRKSPEDALPGVMRTAHVCVVESYTVCALIVVPPIEIPQYGRGFSAVMTTFGSDGRRLKFGFAMP
jgi:hypothetical protein